MIDPEIYYDRRLAEQNQLAQGNASPAIQKVKQIAAQIPKAPQTGGYTICMDFDGVLDHHETGDPIDKIGEPLEPGIQLAKQIKKAGHRLVILTARPEQMHDTILGWLKGQGVKADEVTNVKPPAAMYIDDRAAEWPQNFAGHMTETVKRIDSFGRPLREHGTKGQKWGVRKSKDKAERAKASYVMVTPGKVQKSKQWEQKVAAVLKGKSFVDNEPLDVLAGKLGVEIKVIDAGKNDKITMHPDSLERKVKEAKRLGLETATVCIDTRGGKEQIYFKEGLGSFRLGSMEKIKNLADLRKRLG